jgi:hypothetical protein
MTDLSAHAVDPDVFAAASPAAPSRSFAGTQHGNATVALPGVAATHTAFRAINHSMDTTVRQFSATLRTRADRSAMPPRGFQTP